MPDTPLTPEEKLLRIIESPQGAAKPAHFRRPALQDLKFNWKAILEKYLRFIRERYQDYLNLKVINIILMVIAASATIYVLIDFPLGRPRPDTLKQIQAAAKKFNIGDLDVADLSPLNIFMQEITQRNMFSLAQAKTADASGSATSSTASKAAREKVESASSELKLVGIIWSDVPQAIIEDTEDSRTYLVNRGSKVQKMLVKDILKDRVVLSYDKQEIELR